MKIFILSFIVLISNNTFAAKVSSSQIKKIVYELKAENKENKEKKMNNYFAYNRLESFNDYIDNEKKKKSSNSPVIDFRLPLIWYHEEF